MLGHEVILFAGRNLGEWVVSESKGPEEKGKRGGKCRHMDLPEFVVTSTCLMFKV